MAGALARVFVHEHVHVHEGLERREVEVRQRQLRRNLGAERYTTVP